MKTKERIVKKAIDLYNEFGFRNVTSRQIAKELGMSHGNLEYHYPNKEMLLVAIYTKMRDEASSFYPLEEVLNHESLPLLFKIINQLDTFQQSYRFFHVDVLEIYRAFPHVKLLLKSTFVVRKKQIKLVFEAMSNQGYLLPEPHEGCYTQLQHTLRIVITFWQPQQLILSHFSDASSNNLSVHLWSIIEPHLSAKGKACYPIIFGDHK